MGCVAHHGRLATLLDSKGMMDYMHHSRGMYGWALPENDPKARGAPRVHVVMATRMFSVPYDTCTITPCNNSNPPSPPASVDARPPTNPNCRCRCTSKSPHLDSGPIAASRWHGVFASCARAHTNVWCIASSACTSPRAPTSVFPLMIPCPSWVQQAGSGSRRLSKVR
jgi:hypothetical protein